jgi:hypothetical protein
MSLFLGVEKAGFELVRYNDLRAGLAAFFFSFLIIVLLAGIICTFNTVKGQRFSHPPARMSRTKLSRAGNKLIISGQGEFG